MNRAILEVCAPWCVLLAALCGLFVVIAWLSGGQWRLSRLRRLHRCESGGVQSLAFVLTLPLLIWILMFIVQISQLMTGLVIVNYAAYASARAASVWTPTMLADQYSGLGGDHDGDDQNELPPGIVPGQRIPLTAETVAQVQSRKYEKIWRAAALACVPISPSEVTEDAYRGIQATGQTSSVLQTLYPLFDARSQTNSVMPQRINAKLGYSFANTYVMLSFEDRNSQPQSGTNTYNPIEHPTVEYFPSEVGWQDPITVEVYYDFRLLPGVGPLIAKTVNTELTSPDDPLIRHEAGVYKTRLSASATMTNEGIRSERPYIYPEYQ